MLHKTNHGRTENSTPIFTCGSYLYSCGSALQLLSYYFKFAFLVKRWDKRAKIAASVNKLTPRCMGDWLIKRITPSKEKLRSLELKFSDVVVIPNPAMVKMRRAGMRIEKSMVRCLFRR